MPTKNMYVCEYLPSEEQSPEVAEYMVAFQFIRQVLTDLSTSVAEVCLSDTLSNIYTRHSLNKYIVNILKFQTLFLFSNKMLLHRRNSQNVCQNSKQGRCKHVQCSPFIMLCLESIGIRG